MLKQLFYSNQFLIIQASHCTLKYLLISKAKKFFNIVDQGETSFECKTALQTLSSWSKRLPTLALFSSKEGLFFSLDSTLCKKEPEVFLEKKLEKELLGCKMQVRKIGQSSSLPLFFALPQKSLLESKDIFERASIHYDFFIPSFYAPYCYLQKEGLITKSDFWAFLDESGFIFLKTEKGKLLDGFILSSKEHEKIDAFLLKALFYLKNVRQWRLNTMGFMGSFAPETLEDLSAKTGIHLFKVKENNEFCIQDLSALTFSTLPKHFCRPSNSIKKQILFSPLKTAFFFSFILLALFLQGTSWASLIREQKKENIRLFEALRQSYPSILPQSFSFSSNAQGLDRLRKIYGAKSKENKNGAYFSVALSPLLSWIAQLNKNLCDVNKSYGFKLLSMSCEWPIGENKPPQISFVLKSSSPLASKALREQIKNSSFIYVPSTLRSSFQNNECRVSFVLNESYFKALGHDEQS